MNKKFFHKLHSDSKVKKILHWTIYRIGKFRASSFDVGIECRFGFPLWLDGAKIKVGDYSYLGPRANINSEITIGKGVLISSDFRLAGNDHDYRKIGQPLRVAPAKQVNKTIIEDDVWIGSRVTLKAGIKIGKGAIVATNSFVNRDVPAYSIVGGIPAREISKRFNEEEIITHEEKIYGEV